MKKRMLETIKRNAPTILSIAASIGVVAGTVLTTYETIKAVDILEEKKNATKKDKIIALTPLVAPIIALDAITIGCILGSNKLNRKAQMALIASCESLRSYISNYRKEVISRHGVEEDAEINTIAISHYRSDYHEQGLDTPDQKIVFIDPSTGNSVCCYEREMIDAVYHIGRNYALRGYTTKNEMNYFMRLPLEEDGDKYGYHAYSGIGWPDIEWKQLDHCDDGGYPICEIIYMFEPEDLSEYE